MKYEEFKEYIKQLQNVYDKKMSQEEVEVWYENLKFMSIGRFNYIIGEIYKTKTFMPKLAEIIDIHKSIPYKEDIQDTSESCEKCNNTGYVIYSKIIEGMDYKYGAVCDCGRQTRYDGQKCSDLKNRSKYYIQTATEIGLKVEGTKPTKEQLLKSMQKLKNSPIVSESIKQIIRKKIYDYVGGYK